MTIQAASPFQLSTQVKPTTPAPRFGCRLFAYMAPKPYPKQDEFLRNCLLEAEDAFQQQVLTPSDTTDNETKHNDLEIDGLQDDGWGLAAYDKRTGKPLVSKSERSAKEDPQFTRVAERFSDQKPLSLLAHLREGQKRIQANAHPFQLGKFVFMHNGNLPKRAVTRLEKKIKRLHAQYGIPLPQGSTDSERVFLYMMGKLREQAGTLNVARISTRKLEKVFKQTIHELKKWTPAQEQSVIAGNQGQDSDTPQTAPFGMNFVLSDGQRMLASCYKRQLHLGLRKDEDGQVKDLLLATKKVQDTQANQADLHDPIEWQELQNAHMLSANRLKRDLSFKIHPLTRRDPFSLLKQWLQ